MSLQEKLDQVKKQFTAEAPAEAVSLIEQSTEDLIQSNIMDQVLGPGDPMPPFTLPDSNGQMISSTELLARGVLVVSFYRGVW